MVVLVIFIDGKLEVINFYNIFHIFKLQYNYLSLNIIEKVGYIILAKNEKMIVYNNKDNIIFEAIRIGTSYLINISTNKKTLILASLYLILYINIL